VFVCFATSLSFLLPFFLFEETPFVPVLMLVLMAFLNSDLSALLSVSVSGLAAVLMMMSAFACGGALLSLFF
jgi:hypothetical protein